jgi:hypothetical protein
MTAEKSLVTELLENTQTSSMRDYEGIEVFTGVFITPPYAELFYGRAIYDQIPYGIPECVVDSYYDNREFYENGLPQEWKDMFNKISYRRSTCGIHDPLDFQWSVMFTYLEKKERFKQYGIEEGFDIYNGFVDFSDNEKTKDLMKVILADEELRNHFIEVASLSVPDGHQEWLDYQNISDLIHALDPTTPILDIACGVGISTQKLSEYYTKIIGVERQYHSDFYDDFWKNNDLDFLRGDIRCLPFKDNSFEIVVMTFTEVYLTEESIIRTLCEVNRVLKNKGVLIIGPQATGDYSHFIVLEKNGEKYDKQTIKEYLLNKQQGNNYPTD